MIIFIPIPTRLVQMIYDLHIVLMKPKKHMCNFFFDEFLDIRNFYGNQNIFVQMQYLRLQMQACLLKSVEDIF